MQPNRVGRVLGVSARVAAEKLKGAAAARPGNQAGTAPRPSSSVPGPGRGPGQVQAIPGRAQPGQGPLRIPRVPAASYTGGGRRLARGAGRFGASLWRPFAHATGVLTLEITGVFFALFTLFFTTHAWQIYKTVGWHDRHFAVYTGLGLLFAWFAVSSFWRARRKTGG